MQIQFFHLHNIPSQYTYHLINVNPTVRDATHPRAHKPNALSIVRQVSVAIIGPSRRRYVFHIRSRIRVFSRNWREFETGHEDEEDEEGAARRMGNPPPFLAIRDAPCVLVRVCWSSPPLAATHHVPYPEPRTAAHRSPMPVALLPLLRTRQLVLSLSRFQLLSRRGMVLFSLNSTFLFEHRLICQPIGRAALWRSSRESIYNAGDFCSLSSRAAVLLACSLACAGDTIKHRNFHALAKRVRELSAPPVFPCTKHWANENIIR